MLSKINRIKVNKKTKIISIALVIFIILLSFFIITKNNTGIENTIVELDITQLELTSYSSDYLAWMEYSDEEKNSILEPKKYITNYTGTTPYSLDFEQMSSIYNYNYMDESTAGNDSYSSYYNIAETEYATEIKNQGYTNLCWSFSASTVFEIQLAMSGYGENSLSSLHVSNALVYSFSDYDNPYGIQELNVGGNFLDSFVYWTSGIGPVDDFSGTGTTSLSASTVLSNDATYKIDTMYDLPYFGNSVDDSEEDLLSYISLIKELLITNGGLTFHSASPQSAYGYTYDGYSCTNVYNSTYYSVYAANDYDFGCSAHAMTIVGWDDDFSAENFNSGNQYIDGEWVTTTPSVDGAWIVQNSWGSYGDGGYVYYSYDDAYLYQYLFSIAEISEIDYDYIYQYNPTGAYATFNDAYGENYIFVSSFDKSSDDEYLTEISFYISQIDASEAIDYIIYVNSENGDVTTSSMIQVQSGEDAFSFSGYYTITLDEPILLTGDSYAVGVEFDNAKLYLTVNDSESLSDNEVGLISYQSFFVHYNSVYTYNYANFIKAYTNLAVDTNDITVDTDLKYEIEEDFSNEVIAVKSLTYNIDSGEILEYKIKDSSGLNVTSDFNLTTNIIMSNLSISLIELTSNVDKDLYTVETYYDGSLVDSTLLDLRFMSLSVSNVSYSSNNEVYGSSTIYDEIGGSINFSLVTENIYEGVYLTITDERENVVLSDVIASPNKDDYSDSITFDIDANVLEAGNYTVTITVADGIVYKSFSLTVEEFYGAESISLLVNNENFVDLYLGNSLTLNAVVSPSDAMNSSITYSSSDESVVTVTSDGYLSVVGIGSAVVTASTMDPVITSTLSVTASDPKVAYISSNISGNYLYDENSLYTSYGGEISILFEGNYSVSKSNLEVYLINGSSNTLLSSNDYILNTYDDYYEIIYDVGENISSGNYEIEVISTLNNSEFSTNFTVLSYVKVNNISFSENSLLINIDDNPVLDYEISPSNATNAGITFQSSDESIAVVTSSGTLIPLSNGEVTISIYCNDDNTISDILNVTIVNELLIIDSENSDYEVVFYNDSSYITGIKVSDDNLIYSEFVKNFTLFNAIVYDNGLKVYDSDIIKSGMTLVAGSLNYTLVVTGDVNGDGLIGSNDVLLIRRYLVGLDELSDAYILAGDVNGSGISSYDALLIRRYLVGLGDI